MRLETAVRVSSDGPRHGRCVLIEIPVPAGITLRPGAAIALTVCIAGSSITLSIPAAGHIHCATCNHKKAGQGAVWRAANAGDAAALEAALAAGGSTEETDGVRRHWNRTPSHCYIASLLVTGRHRSRLCFPARPCGSRPHPPGRGCRRERQGAGASAPANTVFHTVGQPIAASRRVRSDAPYPRHVAAVLFFSTLLCPASPRGHRVVHAVYDPFPRLPPWPLRAGFLSLQLLTAFEGAPLPHPSPACILRGLSNAPSCGRVAGSARARPLPFGVPPMRLQRPPPTHPPPPLLS